MVLEDIFSSFDSSRNQNNDRARFFLAHPLARLGSFVLDFFCIILPLFSLLNIFVRKQIFFQFYINNQVDLSGVVFLGVIFIFVWVSYQTLTLLFFGRTFGQAFFNIRVVKKESGQKLDFDSLFLRSVFFFFSLPLFFWPCLSVFFDPLRQTFHDKVSNTVVLSFGSQALTSPDKSEAYLGLKFFRIFTFALVAFSIFGFHMFYQFWSSQQGVQRVVMGFKQEFNLCNKVSSVNKEWRKKSSRISIALSLYAISDITKECLEKEIEASFRYSKSKSLAHFARSIFVIAQEGLASEYSEATCKQGQQELGCLLSQFVYGELDFYSGSFQKALQKDFFLFGSWALHIFMEKNQYAQAREIIAQFPPNPDMALFFHAVKPKIFWGVNKKEKSIVAANLAYGSLPQKDAVQLSSWMCFHQLSESCKYVDENSCQLATSFLKENVSLWNNSHSVLGFIYSQECKEADYDHLAKKSLSMEARLLFRAISFEKKGSTQAAQNIYQKMSEDSRLKFDYRSEAVLRGFNKKGFQYNQYLIDWLVHSAESFQWIRVGKKIFRQSFEAEKFEDAFQVGQRLTEVVPEKALTQKMKYIVKNLLKKPPDFRLPSSENRKKSK